MYSFILRGSMANIIRSLSQEDRLNLLADQSKYDLAGACSFGPDGKGRVRSSDDQWIYPVTLPNGRRASLFKTLISNICSSDCGYCPLRADQDFRRCSLAPEETVRLFLHYKRTKRVSGIFISSGITGSPDSAMENLLTIARILRYRERYKGYIHIKVLPGVSDAAVEEAVRLASAVSLNIETAGEKHFNVLSEKKNYLNDVIAPMKLISSLSKDRERFGKVSFTTQFVVGASTETDRELLTYMDGLYNRLGLKRLYFSAYQAGSGRSDLPGESGAASSRDRLDREHRLYQVDFLMRQYGFDAKEIPLGQEGNLSLTKDPKQAWADANPHRFPIDVNRASRKDLLRVPGLGPTAVKRIISARKERKISSIEGITKQKFNLEKAKSYIHY